MVYMWIFEVPIASRSPVLTPFFPFGVLNRPLLEDNIDPTCSQCVTTLGSYCADRTQLALSRAHPYS